MDDHTKRLFEDATILAARTLVDASSGVHFYGSAERASLVAARMNATATIFAALVEADLARQIREIREQHNAG